MKFLILTVIMISMINTCPNEKFCQGCSENEDKTKQAICDLCYDGYFDKSKSQCVIFEKSQRIHKCLSYQNIDETKCYRSKYWWNDILWIKIFMKRNVMDQSTDETTCYGSKYWWNEMLWIKVLTKRHVLDQNIELKKCYRSNYWWNDMLWIKILMKQNVIDQSTDETKCYGSKYWWN